MSPESTQWGNSFKCDHCEKLLFLKLNLNLIRSGEKSYKCEECDKSLIKKLVLYIIREHAVV